jgi:class 3 adenylate cyclase/tetratricopeptide (TPR) repeat protein
MDLESWLFSLGLGEYVPAFTENRISLDLVPELTDQDLRDLGIAALGDRKRLLAAIGNLDAKPLSSAPSAQSEGERRQVTVLFADIAGFTEMSERLGAEATHEVLNRYFETADRIVEEYGGAIDKHIGDNVMAVFGAPVAHDNDPERAVRAALAIHKAAQAIEANGHPLQLHIGIACGQVVASGTGSDSHREYTVTGDTVNLAARLEGLAKAGQTLVSGVVQLRTAGLFEISALGPQSLKGIEQPVSVWRIDAEAETGRLSHVTQFVGRRSELGQCRAILSEVAATGEGQTILLRGPAGIGKTRLADQVATAAREAGFSVHRSLVLDFGSGKGQRAIPALVRSLIGLPHSSTKEDRARAADEAFAAGAYAEAERVFLNDLLDLPQPLELRRIYDAMDDATRRGGRRELVAGLVIWASRTAPRLILIEDLHWADEQTLDRLAAIMAAASEHPIALLATTRPEGDPLQGDWRIATQDLPVSIINLGPLRASEAQAMAAGFARANEDRLAECLKRAAGNPLFLEQLLQNVAESATAMVPGSIQSLVLARMDRLVTADKRALQAASILGQQFSLAAVRHLMDDLAYDCSGLLQHQLIRPESADYLFAHALIRDGVYESILTAARTRLHLKAAEWFELSDPALFANHLELADDPRAARAYHDAAQAEMIKYHYILAIDLLNKGRALARDPTDRVALALAVGHARHDTGALEDARLAFEEVLADAADDSARCKALLGIAGVKRITEDLDGALADLETAENVAQRLGLIAEQARIHHLRGNILFPRGETERCLQEHGRSLELARQAKSVEMEAAALSGLADCAYLRGRFRTACQRFTECVEISQSHGLGRIEVANQPLISVTAVWCGNLQHALDVALASVEAARRVGHGRAEMIAGDAACICYRMRGELDLSRQQIENSIAVARALGARRFEAEGLCFLGHLDFLEGRQVEALERVHTAIAIIRETGMAFFGPTILGVLVLITSDEAESRAAIAEAEELLAVGSVSHNHVYFRFFVIDACLRTGAYDEAERHANLLAAFCPEEGLLLIEFLAQRGLALARVGRGERSDELGMEIDRLITDGERMQQALALAALRDAREVIES